MQRKQILCHFEKYDIIWGQIWLHDGQQINISNKRLLNQIEKLKENVR